MNSGTRDARHASNARRASRVARRRGRRGSLGCYRASCTLGGFYQRMRKQEGRARPPRLVLPSITGCLRA